MSDSAALERVLAHTTRRMRLARAYAWSGYALGLGAGAAAAWCFADLYLGHRPSLPRSALVFASVVVSTWLVRMLAGVRAEDAAQALDSAHGLHDRLRSAVEFAAAPSGQRTRYMDAAVRDAWSHAQQVSPERAVQFARPRGLPFALASGALWAALLLWPPAQRVRPVTPSAKTKLRPALETDDAQAFRAELGRLSSEPALTPEARDEVHRYNALLERLATGELTREQGIEALLSLERKLMREQQGVSDADRSLLKELAGDLAKAQQTLARALSEQKLDEAASELDKLAQRAKHGELTQEERERLERALARERSRNEAREAKSARERELESLLRKKDESPKNAPAEKSLFDKQRRELERLRREREADSKRHRELERLSRDLSDGARALSENTNAEAGEALSRAAEDLSRYRDDQLTQEQRSALQKQVQQLRELMQRSGQQQKQQRGQGGQGADQDGERERMQRFVLRAQGKNPGQDDTKLVMRQPGKQGSGDKGEQGQGGDGERPQQSGQGQKPGDEGAGAGSIELGGQGQGTAILELPSERRVVSTQGAGAEHDPKTLQAPTKLSGEHDDARLPGIPGGGPSRSEVILDAADRGFATSSYRKVYSDYRTHAEDVLEQDEIPPGYRFYVRRYFQLIRPRDTGEAP